MSTFFMEVILRNKGIFFKEDYFCYNMNKSRLEVVGYDQDTESKLQLHHST
jgi:hypothetical protein